MNISKFIIILSVVLNYVYISSSLIGDNIFYPNDLFHETRILKKHWKVFRDEALKTYKFYTTIQGDMFFESDIIKDSTKWNKLYFKWLGDMNSHARVLCPESCKIIESLPGVKIAMFSVLNPGAHIKLHNGPYKGMLRYHLGLKTPNDDDCFICIGGHRYSWRDGEGILFDDTRKHYVRNDTNETRIVLFCDIERPMSFGGKYLNKFILRLLGPLTSRV